MCGKRRAIKDSKKKKKKLPRKFHVKSHVMITHLESSSESIEASAQQRFSGDVIFIFVVFHNKRHFAHCKFSLECDDLFRGFLKGL